MLLALLKSIFGVCQENSGRNKQGHTPPHFETEKSRRAIALQRPSTGVVQGYSPEAAYGRAKSMIWRRS